MNWELYVPQGDALPTVFEFFGEGTFRSVRLSLPFLYLT